MKTLKTILSVMVITSIGSVAVLVTHNKASATTADQRVNRTYNAAKNYREVFTQASEDLTALQTNLASEGDVTTFDQAAETVLNSIDDMQGAALFAKNRTRHLYFISVKEKESLRSRMSAVIANLELSQQNVAEISDDFASDADEVAALASLETELADLVTYIGEHDDEYGTIVRNYFLIALDQAITQTNNGLTAIAEISDIYEELGANVTTLNKRYDKANLWYGYAVDSFASAKAEEADVDLKAKYYSQAAYQIIVARLWLASAQAAVNAIEVLQLAD